MERKSESANVRQKVYATMHRLLSKREGNDRGVTKREIEYHSKIGSKEAGAALKFLQRQGLARREGKKFWFTSPLPRYGICWVHGKPLIENACPIRGCTTRREIDNGKTETS